MENSLVIIKGQNVMTDSLTVAEHFKKQHKHVMEKIESILRDDEKDRSNFRPISYQDSYDREQKKYLMDRRSFSILCMSFTGKKALEWKHRFFDAFEAMEKALLQKHIQQKDAVWLAQRTAGKITLLEKTDTIKEFVDYAISQGSSNASRYYANIAKMQNQALFLLEQKFKNLRDILDLNQLATVNSADAIVKRAITEGMTKGLHYKEIYQLAKSRIETFADLRGKTFIPVTQTLRLAQA